ncbi:MAG: response regulator transcription factor [Gammaproteobacteria bacterium]
MRVLIIEDNRDLAIELADYFEGLGDVVDAAADGVTGLHLAVVNRYDAIVLDLNLPGLGGLELCRRLRQDADKWVPVLMLTARDTLADRIAGFERGADDYLVKPFSLKELSLRLRSIVRRHADVSCNIVLTVDGLILNADTREVRRNEKALELTVIEFQILEMLMRRSPNVVTREEISERVWGDEPPDGDVLRVHIHHLRNAIDKGFDTPLLHTIRGVGYRLTANDALPS